MRSFFYMLDKTIEQSQINHNKKLEDFCYDVRDYINKGTFTKYKKVKTILGYWGQPDYYVAEKTGMKDGAVRQARRNLSNELYELFGYDFFNIIIIGDDEALKEGGYRLYLAKMGYSSGNFLYREMISDIRNRGSIDDDIDISSCALEIQFLVRHSKQSIEEELSMLDKEKLIYLIRMLDNEVGSPLSIRNLIKCFEKENGYE